MVFNQRQAKIILAAKKAHDLFVKGVGDKDRQRRALARWQKLDALRRRECPSMIGVQVA